jgi:hypothetical protein
MKFPSERSALVALIFFTAISVLATLILRPFFFETSSGLLAPLLLSIPLIFLLWLWFDTSYKIEGSALVYCSGPFRGKISISSIREIEASKALFVGLKPALSMEGLIIRFNRYDEIFLSPQDKEEFAEILCRLNPSIVVKNLELHSDNPH